MTDRPTLHIRFLRSGLTHAGRVWRTGQVLEIEPGHDRYDYFARTESEQRKRWGAARWEHITADEYAEALGRPSTPSEKAPPKPTKQAPPPPEDGAQRDPVRSIPAAPSHTPPANPTPPPADLDTDARWPWYTDADVATTLGHVANMSENEAQDFLAWEQAHKARKGVLGPMTGS